jgi:hypothetical protein
MGMKMLEILGWLLLGGAAGAAACYLIIIIYIAGQMRW